MQYNIPNIVSSYELDYDHIILY